MIRLSIQLSARTHIHFSCVFNSNSFQLAVPPQLTFLWGGGGGVGGEGVCVTHSHECNGEAISLSQTERGRLSEPHHPPMKLIPPLSACRFPLASSMLLLSVILARWRSCLDLTKMHQNLRVVFGFSVLQLVSV